VDRSGSGGIRASRCVSLCGTDSFQIYIFIQAYIYIYTHTHICIRINRGPSWIDRGIGGSEQAAVYLSAALMHYKCIYLYKHIYIYIYIHPHMHIRIRINRGPSWIDRGIGGSEQAAVYLAAALQRVGWQVEIYARPAAEDIGLDPYIHIHI